eukprot:gb/GFBE01022258.1/.p1 GENE.gb/GFBE01022258.1/~~gb/GFBE01022258.1/.p1  ORF type:complete len:731 (+),score=112.29 gb/GFBE01022258.1/:1-2193(+)
MSMATLACSLLAPLKRSMLCWAFAVLILGLTLAVGEEQRGGGEGGRGEQADEVHEARSAQCSGQREALANLIGQACMLAKGDSESQTCTEYATNFITKGALYGAAWFQDLFVPGRTAASVVECAGFGRSTKPSKEELVEWARSKNAVMLHRLTNLGRMLENHKVEEMKNCDGDSTKLFWASASEAFVKQFPRIQVPILIFINKGSTEGRNLSSSELWRIALPTLAHELQVQALWSPDITIIDFQGMCANIGPQIWDQLESHNAPPAKLRGLRCSDCITGDVTSIDQCIAKGSQPVSKLDKDPTEEEKRQKSIDMKKLDDYLKRRRHNVFTSRIEVTETLFQDMKNSLNTPDEVPGWFIRMFGVQVSAAVEKKLGNADCPGQVQTFHEELWSRIVPILNNSVVSQDVLSQHLNISVQDAGMIQLTQQIQTIHESLMMPRKGADDVGIDVRATYALWAGMRDPKCGTKPEVWKTELTAFCRKIQRQCATLAETTALGEVLSHEGVSHFNNCSYLDTTRKFWERVSNSFAEHMRFVGSHQVDIVVAKDACQNQIDRRCIAGTILYEVELPALARNYGKLSEVLNATWAPDINIYSLSANCDQLLPLFKQQFSQHHGKQCVRALVSCRNCATLKECDGRAADSDDVWCEGSASRVPMPSSSAVDIHVPVPHDLSAELVVGEIVSGAGSDFGEHQLGRDELNKVAADIKSESAQSSSPSSYYKNTAKVLEECNSS